MAQAAWPARGTPTSSASSLQSGASPFPTPLLFQRSMPAPGMAASGQSRPQQRKGNPMNLNTIIHADCLEALPRLPSESVNLVLTDPPYLANYKSRDGRSVPHDDNANS